ncbi:hypothetical protein AMS68_004356 [Peltaster fructicola]|uniref:Uncharacterized protein n=1 Tax=Peltaster fructicola TaxID=286661 RepID=A0A6H0XW49_9PEZI|nr:hypothetical protein AMS68_004356 [Peltaster fructicola]
MNNEEFRRLLAKEPTYDDEPASDARESKKKSAALGSHKSGSLGMAPRAVRSGKDTNFSRRAFGKDGEPATKKFKSSAPRGSTIAAGYIDRAKARATAEDNAERDDKAERIKALEEQLKLEQISQETFERLREEIAGGNISSTHLIKGLDRKLLDRVRRGEDVLGDTLQPAAPAMKVAAKVDSMVDVDDELDRLEDATIEAVQKEKTEKKGVTATGGAAGKTRTRDEIMAELKAQRKMQAEAQTAAQPVTDTRRWRKVGDLSSSRIEIDRKGREVLITVDADGVVKKRVRKKPKQQTYQQPTAPVEPELPPAPEEEVLDPGTVVIEQPSQTVLVQDDDDDIFEDAGTDYDPLGPDEDSEDETTDLNARPKPLLQPHHAADTESKPARKRNYFNDEPNAAAQPTADHMAGIKAVIEKAGKLKSTIEPEPEDTAEAARRARHARMLANEDRDLDDMDLGFGASRFEDGEDGADGEKVKLSEWKGSKHNADDEPNDKGSSDRKKRKPKKRKGDANSFADIMTVIERRNGSKN